MSALWMGSVLGWRWRFSIPVDRGLRFREEPGIDADIQFIANDREVFRIEGGPVEEDGFVWWYLVSVEVSGRRGWAVSSYLQLAE